MQDNELHSWDILLTLAEVNIDKRFIEIGIADVTKGVGSGPANNLYLTINRIVASCIVAKKGCN